MPNTIIGIPARMGSHRLPNKPLRTIAGTPMIVHVWRRATAADIGEVLVACDSDDIVDAIHSEGGKAVLTPSDLPSGTDRVHHAIKYANGVLNGDEFDSVINLQGDLPDIDSQVIKTFAESMEKHKNAYPMMTLDAPLTDEDEDKPQVVKSIVKSRNGDGIGEAKTFMRHVNGAFANETDIEIGHHIGIYGWQREALSQFVAWKPTANEKTEKLEQLRAVDKKMPIGVLRIGLAPLGVDTDDDLAAVRAHMSPPSN
ncbi:MAG: 3-deoxy-manno-octulosonate cytidylyltransferase [Proteobacteria bacterium]|nr:3-deoxy-manno-octulosonate cytidylyltransferase [Pseudomonadota bacterium]